MARTASVRYEQPERSNLDWRAVAVAVLFNAAVFVLVLHSRWSEPIRAALQQALLVELHEQPALPIDNRPSAHTNHSANSGTPQRRNPTTHTARAQPKPIPTQTVIAPSTDVGTAQVLSATASVSAGMGGSGTSGDRGGGARIASHYRPPRVLRRQLPNYPADALSSGGEGSVEVLVTISADGVPTAAQLQRSSGTASLDKAGVEAVMKYTFRPAENDGHTVTSQAIVAIDWTIGSTTTLHLGSAAPAAASQCHPNASETRIRRASERCD